MQDHDSTSPSASASLSPTDVAWIAGFVDGEGCLTITRQRAKGSVLGEYIYYRPVLVIANNDKPSLDWIQTQLRVGHVATIRHGTDRWAPSYQYVVGGFAALKVVRLISPYLRIKCRQAALLLQFPGAAASTTWPDPTLDERRGAVRTEREYLASAVQELNARGPRTTEALS